MRVLITSTPGVGHIHPLVPLATALQRAGHHVTWATGQAACDRLDQLGVATLPAGMDTTPRQAEFRRRCPEITTMPPRAVRALAYPTMFGAIAAPVMFADLQRVFDAVRPEVVLHEPGELAAAPTAAGRGIPHVTVGFGNLIPDALLATAAAEVAELWDAAGVATSESCGLYDDLYLHPFPPSLTTPTAAGGRATDDGTLRRARPLAFDGRVDDEAPAWTAALGVDRPCIYVTFGTEHAARAPFASVAESVDGLDADVVVTTGPTVEPSAIGTVPANVRVESYVPQRFVLRRAAVIASHGGSGAVLGAAELGLPQLCLPMGADQFDNADAITTCGAGMILEPHLVDAGALREALSRLLDDRDIRDRAVAVAGEIEAMPHPDELVRSIVDLAR